ncbi:phage major capsid protein [Comamonas serinivorans]|uniref:Phage major capsid protein n=1 Tax=Comamonas serinivorans TaxID=1082851 RepID=A0A1Y0EN68_9BURK|nr:phage major capsid protein [Comamonas serinivorans]ARU04749.1 phage major capsid protein [Comamonas serinivorans]
MTDTVNIEQAYQQVQVNLKETGDKLKQYAEKTETEMKNLGKTSEETKAAVDQLLPKFNAMQKQFLELQQELARPKGDDKSAPQSAGDLVVNSDQMQGVNSSFRGSRRIEVPRQAITTATAGSLVVSDRQYGIVTPPEKRLTVRDLIAPGQTASNNIEYVRESGFTNSAAPVAEGAAKPYSDITFALENAPVRVLAHLFKASRQILDDAPALKSYIDARAEYGIKLAEEAQLLYGNGTGANLNGLIPQATAYAAPAGITVTGEQRIDRIRLAILQAILAEFPASGVVLHPTDWAAIELTKDSQGRYLIGRPQDGTPARLWNLPVVETTAITQNSFLTGAFSLGAQIFDRMAVEILISTENDKDFENNMVTIRAEERLALAVYRPEAFVTGELTGP